MTLSNKLGVVCEMTQKREKRKEVRGQDESNIQLSFYIFA